MPFNPFMVKAGIRMIRDAGADVGDTITITWDIDPRYGVPEQGRFTGKIEKMPEVSHVWLRVRDAQQVLWNYPVTCVRSVEKVSE